MFPVPFLYQLERYLSDDECSALARTCKAYLALAYFRIANVLRWGDVPSILVRFPSDAWLHYHAAKITSLSANADPISLQTYINGGVWKMKPITTTTNVTYPMIPYVLSGNWRARCMLHMIRNDLDAFNRACLRNSHDHLFSTTTLTVAILYACSYPEFNMQLLLSASMGGCAAHDYHICDKVDYAIQYTAANTIDDKQYSLLENPEFRKWMLKIISCNKIYDMSGYISTLMWKLFTNNGGVKRFERMIQQGVYSKEELIRTINSKFMIVREGLTMAGYLAAKITQQQIDAVSQCRYTQCLRPQMEKWISKK